MDLDAYQRALYQGFSERDATRIGEDAWESNQIYAARMNTMAQGQYFPMCEICGLAPAVTGANGYGVCSEACCHIAWGRDSSKGEADADSL